MSANYYTITEHRSLTKNYIKKNKFPVYRYKMYIYIFFILIIIKFGFQLSGKK